MKKTINYAIGISLSIWFLASCQKYLDAKPSEAYVVPQTIADFQALMDNSRFINGSEANFGLYPNLGEISADDYYINDESQFNTLEDFYRGVYTWAEQLPAKEQLLDWNLAYQAIFYTNVALEGMADIPETPANKTSRNLVMGCALFHRSSLYFQLVQLFSPPYSETAKNDIGLPIREKSDVSETLRQATLSETYDIILRDLKLSVNLLPDDALYPIRPSRPAAYALLSRVYLSMRYYEEAGSYADSCLQLRNEIIDFNDYTQAGPTSAPFPRFNNEVIFHSLMLSRSTTPIRPIMAVADTLLYASYQEHDLRKTLYFRPRLTGNPASGQRFRGSYDGTSEHFTGLATDEMYLTRAECRARSGQTALALEDLNKLLEKRFATGYFVPVTEQDTNSLLKLILEERRKELQRRGTRWMDLRRLNQEAGFAVNLQRNILGQSYSLPAGNSRYTFTYPSKVIGFNPQYRIHQR